LVSKSGQDLFENLPLNGQFFRRFFLSLHSVQTAEVFPRQPTQLRIGRSNALFALPAVPLLEQVLQVPFQDRLQVMMGIELVLVADACEVDRHF
jgi:hypothetical protein